MLPPQWRWRIRFAALIRNVVTPGFDRGPQSAIRNWHALWPILVLFNALLRPSVGRPDGDDRRLRDVPEGHHHGDPFGAGFRTADLFGVQRVDPFDRDGSAPVGRIRQGGAVPGGERRFDPT